jgi:enoyl-CoA hydratase/carnithine racemase
VRAAVIDGEGEHFCAGLDLSELKERDAGQGLHHSRMWHAALERVQYGPVPVIAALHGAVVGGGLELASACHIRVADDTTFYALPEGSRGIFVGGGGAVRIPKLIGVARMTDMMLTGRVYNAADGERIGFAQYLVPAGQAFAKALELAVRVAQNAPLTNYALMHALPRIAEQPADQGFLTEAMMAGHRPERARGQEPACAPSWKAGRQGQEGLKHRSAPRHERDNPHPEVPAADVRRDPRGPARGRRGVRYLRADQAAAPLPAA